MLLSPFQHQLENVVARTRDVDIRAFEISSTDRLIEDLAPEVLDILGEGRSVLSAVLNTCEQVTERLEQSGEAAASDAPTMSFELAIDTTIGKGLGSHHAVEEIAFLAQMELSQRQQRLSRTEAAHGTLAVLGECDSSIRRVRKALTAVDVAIANAEAVPPRLDYRSELDSSLAVRRAYAKFRRRLLVGGEPTPEELHARFRAAGTQIAMLVGWEIYPEMRVRDRLLLRDLQQRILTWLRSDQEVDVTAGMRLWQDLTAFLHMLALVNRRQELMAHDAEMLRQVQQRLAQASGQSAVDETAWKLLQALEGMNDDVDAMLLEEQRPRVDNCVRLLDSVTASMGTATEVSP